MVSIGDIVGKLRTERKLSQEQLAEKVGVTRSTISLYESGVRSPSLDSLVALSHALNVTTDYLLGVSKDTSAFLDISGLTPEQIAAVDAIVENFKKCNAR